MANKNCSQQKDSYTLGKFLSQALLSISVLAVEDCNWCIMDQSFTFKFTYLSVA